MPGLGAEMRQVDGRHRIGRQHSQHPVSYTHLDVYKRQVLQNRRGSGSIASLLMADNEASGPALTTEGKPLKDYVEALERMLIDNTMRRHKGSITAVMDELCLPRRTLDEKMAKYGLQRQEYV